jgi:hypothetical protein
MMRQDVHKERSGNNIAHDNARVKGIWVCFCSALLRSVAHCRELLRDTSTARSVRPTGTTCGRCPAAQVGPGVQEGAVKVADHGRPHGMSPVLALGDGAQAGTG